MIASQRGSQEGVGYGADPDTEYVSYSGRA